MRVCIGGDSGRTRTEPVEYLRQPCGVLRRRDLLQEVVRAFEVVRDRLPNAAHFTDPTGRLRVLQEEPAALTESPSVVAGKDVDADPVMCQTPALEAGKLGLAEGSVLGRQRNCRNGVSGTLALLPGEELPYRLTGGVVRTPHPEQHPDAAFDRPGIECTGSETHSGPPEQLLVFG